MAITIAKVLHFRFVRLVSGILVGEFLKMENVLKWKAPLVTGSPYSLHVHDRQEEI